MNRLHLITPFLLVLAACSEEVGKPSSSGTNPTSNDPGTTLEVPVPMQGRAFVSLEKPQIVTPVGDGSMDTTWDIAFENYEIFTNSGVSGPGDGGAFGPLDLATYDAGVASGIPFITEDKTGGPFSDFWAYESSTHVLWMRYHVFGVREGDKLWKVQILGYYAEVQGAPVSAIYRLRWAEVNSAGIGTTKELADIDGTANGSQASDDVPSECLDLGSGARIFHTPAEARTTKDWHLCFRRASVSVNGELGGPRGITAVDLHASETNAETLDILKKRTDDSELARFDAVGFSELNEIKLVWRGDRILSAFSDYWVDPGTSPKEPAKSSWLTQSADGSGRYLLVFDRFDGATETNPGTMTMRIRPENF